MSVRVLVIILVLLVALFVVGVVAGNAQGPGVGVDATPALLESLGKRLNRQSPLTVADVEAAIPASCSDQLRRGRLDLAPGAGCIFFVGAANAPVRTLRLAIAAGQTAEVVYDPAAANRFTARQTLNGDELLELSIFQEGGEVRIVCTGVGAADVCVITTR